MFHWLALTKIVVVRFEFLRSEVKGLRKKYFSLGIALDGHLKDDDVNLASSTLGAEGKTSAESMGIVISYSLRVKLNCGTLGGELQTDVPFKLLNPAPGNSIKYKNNQICHVLFNSIKVPSNASESMP